MKFHYLNVEDGDGLVVITNPGPSMADPANLIQTVVTFFRIIDEAQLGVSIVPSRKHPDTYAIVAHTLEELKSAVYK